MLTPYPKIFRLPPEWLADHADVRNESCAVIGVRMRAEQTLLNPVHRAGFSLLMPLLVWECSGIMMHTARTQSGSVSFCFNLSFSNYRV